MARTAIIIDDDQDDLDIIKQAITIVDPSMLCLSFVYPEEALRALLHREIVVLPHFIFIDINMPGITGDKVLNALRKDSSYNDTIITLYSTSMPEAVADALKNSGANYVFEKPVRVKAYNEILERIIKLT